VIIAITKCLVKAMNLNPKSSINYDKAIEKTAKMNQGSHHDVGDKRLSVKEIAGIIDKSISRTTELLKTYTAEKLIAREERIRSMALVKILSKENG